MPHRYSLLKQHNAKTIIDALEAYITDQRKTRIDSVISGRLDGLHLAIEAPSDINNALAAVRTSEALGISTVHIIQPKGSAGAARDITQGAIYWVDILYYTSLEEFLNKMRTEKRLLAGGQMQATQTVANIPIVQPLCIIIGNEQRGLSKKALAACDISYQIPMFGMSESLNLSVSAAISLYECSKRKRLHLNNDSDLTMSQQLQIRAKYYLQSVTPRLAQSLLQKDTY